jgi:hypothetical protein
MRGEEMSEARYRTARRRLTAVGAACVVAIGAFAAVGLAEELPVPVDTTTGTTTDTTTDTSTDVVDARKVLVCHKGKRTIHISVNAVPAHAMHGDVVGTCADVLSAKRAAKAARKASRVAAKQALRARQAGVATGEQIASESAESTAPVSAGPGKGKGKSKRGG